MFFLLKKKRKGKPQVLSALSPGSTGPQGQPPDKLCNSSNF